MSGTETALGAAPPTGARTAPHLFVVLEAARPRAGGLRLGLDGVDLVRLGRGEARAATLDGRVLDVRLPDRRMSQQHARLQPTLAGWELIDEGSKNGCRVDDVAVTRAALADGARLEIGQTILIFRAGLAAEGDPVSEGVEVAGVTTLVPALAARLAALARLAASRVSIVIGGESGTGKELVARALHAASGRPGAMVAVNCAALPPSLLEAELFGHRRGAFTGAAEERVGLIRAADRGTLFLDEIGDLAAPAQAALLRALQEREVLPVGEVKPVPVDLRVIAATHRDLPSLVADGGFRADLWARLAGHVEVLPPLRERREDLGVLVASLLARLGADVTLTVEAARALVAADWRLNVRELEKALETAVTLAGGGGPIGVEHLRTPEPATEDPDDVLKARVVALFAEHKGSVSAVARAMGKARMQIQRWMKRFEIDPERFR